MSRLPVDGSPGQPDVCIIELGGTVGDIESMPFIEALRHFSFESALTTFVSSREFGSGRGVQLASRKQSRLNTQFKLYVQLDSRHTCWLAAAKPLSSSP